METPRMQRGNWYDQVVVQLQIEEVTGMTRCSSSDLTPARMPERRPYVQVLHVDEHEIRCRL